MLTIKNAAATIRGESRGVEMPDVRIKIKEPTVGTGGEHWAAGHVATVSESKARDYILNGKAVPAGMVKKTDTPKKAAAPKKASKSKAKGKAKK